jgi:hypothetical protein
MVDFRVTVFDGSYHDVDSNELSFKLAGSLAFKDAMTRARPTILEPVMDVEVYAPSDFAGDLMGDLNGRRGRIAGMDTRGTTTVIKAQVPMSEMLTYEQHLTSATGGRGSYHMEYSHYDEVPAVQRRRSSRLRRPSEAGVGGRGVGTGTPRQRTLPDPARIAPCARARPRRLIVAGEPSSARRWIETTDAAHSPPPDGEGQRVRSAPASAERLPFRVGGHRRRY